MAAPSPTVSNNSSDTATTTTASAVTANAAVSSNHLANRTGTPPKTLRGLNKPKCRVCGNVARSRCPYESCKSCCARNQNPCYIHGALQVVVSNKWYQSHAYDLAMSVPNKEMVSLERYSNGGDLWLSSIESTICSWEEELT